MQIPEPSTLNRIFKNGDEFFINRGEEHTKENCVYHSHHFVELCYVYSGCGYHVVEETQYSVSKGDFFIINYDVPHVFYRDEGTDLITYNIMFKPGFFDSMLLNFNDFDSLVFSYLFRNVCDEINPKENLSLNLEEQKDFEHIIENIYKEYQLKQDGLG